MAGNTEDDANFERRVADIARRFGAWELDPSLYSGALLYMVAHYERTRAGVPAPREDCQQLRDENAALRAQLRELWPGGSSPRTRFATDVERRAYQRGYVAGFQRGRRPSKNARFAAKG